jgi:hypothetical protein
MNNKKWIKTLLAALCVSMITACDGISGTGGPSRVADDSGADKQTPKEGQAVLGPIVGATVMIRDIEDINAIACSTTTADNSDLAKAGAISFSEPCIFGDHLYVVTVSGGNDIDYDDDGARDATATPNTGEFRALLSGEQLLQNNWKTNALTETAFQAVQYALQQDAADIVATLDDLAQQLVSRDLNTDGVINRFDIALWHPVTDASAAINTDKLRLSTALIHSNRNRTLETIPDMESVVGRIDSLAPARQVIAKDDRLLVTTDTTLLVYQYRDSQATLLASLPLGWIYDMTATDDALYVALGTNGVARVDLETLQVTQRSHITAERITSLQNLVFVSGPVAPEEYALTTLNANGGPAQQLVLHQSAYYQYRSEGTSLPSTGIPLKTVNDTVYWAPGKNVERFTLRDGELLRLPALEPADDFYFRAITDIEAAGNTAYVIASGITYDEYIMLSDIYFLFSGTQLLDEILQTYIQQKISRIDISNSETPIALAALEIADVDSLRYIGGSLVGLGANDISLRDQISLRPLSSLPLPETFSGFDPVKGLDTFNGLLAVAAQENGVLLLDPQRIPVKRFHGTALIESALAGATVTVKKLPENTTNCTTTSDDAGLITITADCLDAEAYYLLEVVGGTQTIGGTAQTFTGTLHTVMRKADFIDLDGNWYVSPLTELAWRTMAASVQAGTLELRAGLDNLAQWWLMPSTSTAIINPPGADDIYRWPTVRDNLNINFDASTWQSVVGALGDGNWATDTLQQLTGVTAFLTLDQQHFNPLSNGDVLVLPTQTTTEIRDAAPPFALRSTLAVPAGRQVLDGDRLVAFDEYASLVRIFNLADPAQPTAVATIALANAQLQFDEFSRFCLASHGLYQIVYGVDGILRRARAWRIEDNALVALTNQDYSTRRLWSVEEDCSDTMLTMSYPGGIDLLQRTNAALTLTESITLPTNFSVNGIATTDNEIFYLASEDVLFGSGESGASRHAHLAVDAAGHTQALTTLDTTGDKRSWNTPPIMLLTDNFLYQLAYDEIRVFDPASLELVHRISPPQRIYYRATTSGDALILSYGNSLWLFAPPP